MRPLFLAATLLVLGCGEMPRPATPAPEPTAVGLPPPATPPAAPEPGCGCTKPAAPPPR